MPAPSTAGSSTSRRTEWVAIVCLLVACKSRPDKKFEEYEGGADRGPVIQGTSGEREESATGGIGQGGLLRPRRASAEPAAQAPADTRIDCDKAISKALIEKYLPDATPQWGEPHESGDGAFVTSCRLVDHGLKGGTIVRYKCGGAFTTEAHGELPCVIEIDELGQGQVADRAAFLADLQAALPAAAR
jgi:hypothetical protein